MEKRVKYSFLLAGLLALFALNPIIQEISGTQILTTIFSVWVLFASLYAISDSRPYILVIASVLGAVSLVLEFLYSTSFSSSILIMILVVETPFFSLITWILFKGLLSAKKVTNDTILGAISVYFLLGLSWAFLYQGVELLFPGAFSHTLGLAEEMTTSVRGSFFYFSFVTMTTIGYGDVTAIHPIGRSFAMLQGVTGQMYIAVLVARLVALYTLQKENTEKA